MEGPSLYLAQEQLRPFKGKVIKEVFGTTTQIELQRCSGKKVKNIFAWGKHLVFQFDQFAIRIHFLLFGTFSAEVSGESITGDYKKSRIPRLAFRFDNGWIEMYNCSILCLPEKDAKNTYDFSRDIMSKEWNPTLALIALKRRDSAEIADVLLDQEIFAGVGNIIKNEVLSLTRIHPRQLVREIPQTTLRDIIRITEEFSEQFYRWRKQFLLRKNLKIHRKSTCPHCAGPVTHEKTGVRNRMSHYCPRCQVFKGLT